MSRTEFRWSIFRIGRSRGCPPIGMFVVICLRNGLDDLFVLFDVFIALKGVVGK